MLAIAFRVSLMGVQGDLEKFLDSLRFGESVIVEYSPDSYAADFWVLLLKRYAEERGHEFLVDDNLDSLYVASEHLRFFGIPDPFKDAVVVKTGGVVEVGNVARKIKLEIEPSIYLKRYEDASREVFSQGGKFINAVLGLEKLFAFLQGYRGFYEMISSIERFMGNPSRKAFYFMDVEVVRTLPMNPLPYLERIATTIVDIRMENERIKGFVRKSPSTGFVGWEVEMPISKLIQ